MIYPKAQGKKSTSLAAKEVNSGYLSMARTVLDDSRAIAEDVLSGKRFLDSAYAEAKVRLDEKRSAENKMADLQKGAPDLVTLVLESRTTLDEALTKLATRKHDQAKLASIKDDSPDLVALVEEGRMSVQDALAADHNRREEERSQRSLAAIQPICARAGPFSSVHGRHPCEGGWSPLI